MRTGVNLIPEGSLEHIVQLAVTAEAAGYDRCWVYDEGLITHDVWVVLTTIAGATSTLQLGPGITNPYTRHPAQTASATASLHEASGGRAFLGIGAGGSLTLDPLGLRRSRPLAAVGESIEIARSLFTGRSVDHDGELFTLRNATMAYAADDIEIWLAGRGPRIVALGAEQADGVLLDFIHRDDLHTQFERVRSHAAVAGRPGAVSYSTSIVLDQADLEAVRPHMTYRLVDAPPAVKKLLGLDESATERIRSAMAGGLDEAALHVRDEWVEPFVIMGDSDTCAARLGELATRHGIDEFVLPVFPMDDEADYLTRVADVLRSAAGASTP